MSALHKAFLPAFAVLVSACDPAALPPSCKVPSAMDPVAETRLVLTPETLAPTLFRGNLPIHLASLGVRQAKEQVNLARAELLPSIRLGALVMSAGQPQFAWTAVESALPFLVPSNWFRAGQAEKLFDAQRLALQIVEQNQFAQAYSMIRLWQVDRNLEAHLFEEAGEAMRAASRMDRSYALGLVTLEEKNRAAAWSTNSAAALAQMRELIGTEVASIRRAFGLSTEIELEMGSGWDLPPASRTEIEADELGLERALEGILASSPEARQLDALVAASQQAKWSAMFGFFGGASLGLFPDSSGRITGSLSGLSAGAGLNFGVSIIPTIRLSQLNVREMELRRLELGQELRQVLESLLAQLKSTATQLKLAGEREQVLLSSFRAARLRLDLGLSSLREFEEAEGAWREAFVARLRAESLLALSRLAWQRVSQEGLFAELPPCMVELKDAS